MRVTTELWVSALVKRVFADGGFAAVARRGAAEAGAVFIIVRNRLGELSLYGPAPQTSYQDAHPTERQFSRLLQSTDEGAVTAKLEREERFDSDIWFVEIETAKEPVEAYLAVVTSD